MNVEELKAKEKELEAAVRGEDPATAAPPVNETEPQEVPTQPEVKTEPATETPQDPQPKPRTNWKKRFTNYKASMDPKVAELRTENTTLRTHMNAMEQRLNQLQAEVDSTKATVDPFDGVFSEAETTAFGQEGLDVVTRAATVAAEAKTEPLKRDLELERERRLKAEQLVLQKERQHNYGIFLSKLERLVPDFQQIDADPRFEQFLSYQDDNSVHSRRKLFEDAEASLNAKTVGDYMLAFKKAAGITPSNPEIDKHIAPVGTTGSPNPQPQESREETMSMTWIKDFTNDVSRGKYKDNMAEAKRIQEKIDAHLSAGKPLTR